MTKIKYVLDRRVAREGDMFPVKMVLVDDDMRASRKDVGILVGKYNWIDSAKDYRHVKGEGADVINARLAYLAAEAMKIVDAAKASGRGRISLPRKLGSEGRKRNMDKVRARASKVIPTFEAYEETKRERGRNTRDSFTYTRRVLCDYMASLCDDPLLLTFDEVTPKWLHGFDGWMEGRGLRMNTRAIHMENLRAVVNYAIREEMTETYGFKSFRIQREKSAHRALPVEEMSRIWHYVGRTEQENWYLDILRISFLLCGMNIKDLYELRKDEVQYGRIVHKRSKTGVLVSVRIEPELGEILERCKGSGEFLLDIAERYVNYKDFLKRMNDGLRRLGDIESRVGRGGRIVGREPMWPFLTSYYVRHTWATLAARVGAPADIIAMGLGHAYGSEMLRVYVDPDYGRLDEWNRKVLDAVIGGERQADEVLTNTAGLTFVWG